MHMLNSSINPSAPDEALLVQNTLNILKLKQFHFLNPPIDAPLSYFKITIIPTTCNI